MKILCITGHIGDDAKITDLDNGRSVINFNVATYEKVKKKDVVHEVTDWFRVSIFGQNQTDFASWLKKGRKVAVTGKLSFDVSENNEKTKTYFNKDIRAYEVELLDKKEVEK